MPEYTSLEKIRLEKIEELRAEKIEPYPTRASARTPARRSLLNSKLPKESRRRESLEVKATLAGRIRASRQWAS